MVLQDAWLRQASIADNIAYRLPGATREQVIEAAKATYVDRFARSCRTATTRCWTRTAPG
jgi:ATP-binding cassette subfamily B protein